ncbi:MAG: DUF3854 domain-containing protein [Betaproteobacteria bacterium]|nr:DUF3854 domain-containing protein [Betaproteobacteria bacterium]
MLADLATSGLDARDAKTMRLRYRSAKETLAYTKSHNAESYGIPYFERGQKVNGFERLRFIGPPLGFAKLTSGEQPRYWQNGKGCRLYLPPHIDWPKVMSDPRITIYIAEGEKKSASMCKQGKPCIGIGGVENWRRDALDELDAFDLKGREVVLVFDAPDTTLNANVIRAQREYAAELTRRGATVGAKRLPDIRAPEKTGLDDFLVARGLKAFEALPVEPVEAPQHNTDLGNARRLLARHGADLRCAPGLGWIAWGGGRWRANGDDAEVMRRAKDTVGAIYGEAAREKDDTRRQALAKWAAASENVGRLKAMVELARTEAEVYVDVTALDADPWLLGVENGVIDLRTGKLRAARREDLVTKCAPVAYDPRARCPVWEKYLHRIMAGDAQIISFLRRAVGYSLTGDTSEKGLFFLYGPTGDNGKTTFVEFLQTFFGDYGRKVSAELLMTRRYANPGPRPDLIALIGRRLVVASELSDTQRFDEAILKDLVGGQDRIDARDLHKGNVNFKPIFKLWLYGNHKPQLRADDDAAWRRLYLVPFDVSIPKTEQDGLLPDKLLAEAPGILNWGLAGLADYRRAGLRPPARVVAATANYRDEEDWLGRFIEEKFIRKGGACSLTLKRLFVMYVNWCHDANIRPLSEPKLHGQLKVKGFKWKSGAHNERYVLDLLEKHDAKY